MLEEIESCGLRDVDGWTSRSGLKIRAEDFVDFLVFTDVVEPELPLWRDWLASAGAKAGDQAD